MNILESTKEEYKKYLNENVFQTINNELGFIYFKRELDYKTINENQTVNLNKERCGLHDILYIQNSKSNTLIHFDYEIRDEKKVSKKVRLDANNTTLDLIFDSNNVLQYLSFMSITDNVELNFLKQLSSFHNNKLELHQCCYYDEKSNKYLYTTDSICYEKEEVNKDKYDETFNSHLAFVLSQMSFELINAICNNMFNNFDIKHYYVFNGYQSNAISCNISELDNQISKLIQRRQLLEQYKEKLDNIKSK